MPPKKIKAQTKVPVESAAPTRKSTRNTRASRSVPPDPPSKKVLPKTVKQENQKTRQTTRSSSAAQTQIQNKKPQEQNKKRNLKQFEESCANDPKDAKKGKGKSASKPPPVKKLKIEKKKNKPTQKIEYAESSEESSDENIQVADDSESAFSEGKAKAQESSSSADEGSAFDESSDQEAEEPSKSESSDMVMIDSSTRKKGSNRRSRPSTAATTNIVAKENQDFNDDDEDLGGNGTNTSDRKAAWKAWKVRSMQAIVESQKEGPWFTHADVVMDAAERRPDHPDHDPSTLFIPDHDFKKLTPGMQRYWQIKRENFDKIVFYRFGQWFVVYFQDAVICSKYMDLVVPPRQIHKIVGFHGREVNQNVEILVEKGYKVAICEQTETSEMMKKRLAESPDKKTQIQAVNREVAQIFTKGTHFNMSAEKSRFDYDTKYVLSFYQQPESTKFGYCYFDMSTLKFYLGTFEDDFTLKRFRTLALTTRPIEALCLSSVDKKDQTISILQNSPSPPALSFISKSSIQGDRNFLKSQIELFFGSDSEQKCPAILKELVENFENDISATALCIAIVYLKQLLLAETSVPVAEFFHQNNADHQDELLKSTSMVIDAQAIEHLEILEVPGVQRSKFMRDGTLLGYLSEHNATAFGKRMLKRWIVGPLKDCAKIEARLDAVEDFLNNDKIREDLVKALRNLPDVERLISRIYTYSVKSSVKAIYIDMAALQRLNEFYDLLKILRQMRTLVEKIFTEDVKSKLCSERLKALTSVREIKGKQKNRNSIFPDYEAALKDFEAMITWKNAGGGKKVPEPKLGLDQEFDTANQEVENNKDKIKQYVQSIRQKLKCEDDSKIEHTTVGRKYRYEIQVHDSLTSKFEDLYKDYDNTSAKKGCQRYTTDQLDKLIETLEESEDHLKACLIPFIRKMFHKFYENKDMFQGAIHCLAELDCLQALAGLATGDENGPMVRPKVTTRKQKDKPYMNLIGMRHPCIQGQLKSEADGRKKTKQFIPNDCQMGVDAEKQANFLLITGPNMGGKSTYLRQTCIAAIMAQIGCFVPAEKCEMSVVDRVFTRIGASDRILENKSTFFVELEETKAILDQSTKDSLVIMDELGRGTSTFDGYSIAHSVLSHLVKRVECRTLFTTHYHMLTTDFKKEIEQGQLALYHMESKHENDTLQFLYKFKPGVAPSSFGILVAQMAGIDAKILQKAKTVAANFEEKLSISSKLNLNK